VTGYSHSGTNSDFYTAKYAAADGGLLWEKRYSAGGARAIGVDESGDVVVTGYSSSGPNTDYYTAKYAALDGALLWEKRYNGPVDGSDFVGQHGLALGQKGIVAVAGTSDGLPGPDIVYNYATVLYRENLPPVSVEITLDGVRIRFTAVPGRAYNIERAPFVTGLWSTIVTSTAPASGIIDYIDANPPTGAGFYRTSAP
jgi:hypothetical protein